jgi:EmrB/QacA subfamily drug resistance transporter
MIKQFNTTYASGQWFILIYLLVLTSFITASGRIGDIVGKKKLYLAGITIFTTASMLCGISDNATFFILFRGLQGLGAAMILSLSMAIATDLTAKEYLGRIMGVLSTVTALGIASGPTIGGILLSFFGWESMFLVNIPFGIIAFWLIYKSVNLSAIRKMAGIDWIGIMLLAATLACYCIGMTMIEKRGPDNPIVLMLFATTIVGLFSFVKFENKTTHPLIDISIFKNKILSGNLIATVLVYAVMITTIILPPFYLSKAAGLSPLEVGLTMSFGPVLTVALSVYAGKTADKYGAKKVMLYAMLAMVIGCLCMSSVTPGQNIAGYLWRIAIIQLGLTFFKTPNNTIIMGIAQPDQRGLLSGFLSLSRILGQITGTAVMGVVFAIAHSITYGFDRVFLINAIIVLFAAIIAFIFTIYERRVS